ncbi:MAG: serine/threonine-protein phosphatase [Candidatus Tectomicrobia bacterium]|nr:serine/threonine-protein phosphatase [Candidatus Tectomicrobia bacterium]
MPDTCHRGLAIIGQHMRSPREERLSLGRDDVLVLYTDGVRDSFTLDEYPQLLHDNAQTIALTIVDQFGRSYDDAACVALRYRQ